MDRLRALVKQGKVNCVIVYKIDRLSRNIVDATSLVLREWDGTCHLKCVMDPVDTTTDLGRMIFSMLAMFADFERGQIRARTVAGKLRRAGEGKSITEAPYGYLRNNGALEIVEHEAVVVRHIFDWYVQGMGVVQICKRLAANGVQTRDGYTWGRSSVARLLANETYKGHHIYGKNRVGREDEPSRVRRDAPLVEMNEHVPAIVDAETWDKAQTARGDRRTRMVYGGRAISSQHLLSGLARCRCGATFISKKDRLGTWYYVCNGRRDKGTCDCGWIPHDAVHGAILSRLLVLKREGAIERLQEASLGISRHRLEDLRVTFAAVEARMKRICQEIERLDRDYRAGSLTAARYERNIASAESEQGLAADKLQALAIELAEAERGARETDALAVHVSQLTLWHTLEIQERRELLRRIVSKLILYRFPQDGSLLIEVRVKDVSLEDE